MESSIERVLLSEEQIQNKVKEFAAKLVPVDDETEGIRVWGYLGRPDNVRGNRNYQNVFINGRLSIIPIDKFQTMETLNLQCTKKIFHNCIIIWAPGGRHGRIYVV